MLAWAPIVRAIEQRSLAAHGAFALDDDERKGELADVATIALLALPVGVAGRRSQDRQRRRTAPPIRSTAGAGASSTLWRLGSARARSIRSAARRTGRFSAGRGARSRCMSRRSAC